MHRTTSLIDIKLRLLEHQLQSIEGLDVDSVASANSQQPPVTTDGTTAAAASVNPAAVASSSSDSGAAPVPGGQEQDGTNNGDEGSAGQTGVDEGKKSIVTNKEHPMYAKFFKMVAMGVPVPAVMHKMTMEGMDASVIEDPDGEYCE